MKILKKEAFLSLCFGVVSLCASFPSSAKNNAIIVHPLENHYVTDHFGVWRGTRSHKGIDLRARYDKVYAFSGGVVTLVKYSGAAGRYIKILHDNGLESVYMHLNKSYVYQNMRVEAGQLIAQSGSTGTKRPHLHFELHRNGVQINPLSFLRSAKCINKVNGVVQDTEGNPIKNVCVLSEDGKVQAISDGLGYFTLKISKKVKLEVFKEGWELNKEQSSNLMATPAGKEVLLVMQAIPEKIDWKSTRWYQDALVASSFDNANVYAYLKENTSGSLFSAIWEEKAETELLQDWAKNKEKEALRQAVLHRRTTRSFRIQLKASRKPLSKAAKKRLANLLDSEITEEKHGGAFAYKYFLKMEADNIEEAQEIQNQIQEKGLEDAFIVCYKDGQKVGLTEML